MNHTIAIVAIVLGCLGVLDIVFVFAVCLLSGRLSRAEESGETPSPTEPEFVRGRQTE